MSRIGKKPIELGEKTTAEMSGNVFKVTGPAGTLSREFRPDIKIAIEGKTVTLTMEKETPENLALWGTYASHVKNMVAGVNKPYVQKLIIEGIGYRGEVKGDKIVFGLGLSHPVNVPIPAGIKVTIEKNVITITGIDKEQVGQFSAFVRALKKPEPYKGKGIMYEGEVIRRKQGKKTV